MNIFEEEFKLKVCEELKGYRSIEELEKKLKVDKNKLKMLLVYLEWLGFIERKNEKYKLKVPKELVKVV